MALNWLIPLIENCGLFVRNFKIIVQNSPYSLIADIPGKSFPSKYSSMAPPPVET